MLADQFSHSLVLPCWQIASAIVWVCRLNWQLTIPVNSKRRFRISMFITPILNHPFQFSLPPKRPPAFSWIRFHAPGGRGEVLWGGFMRANLAAVAVQLSAAIYLIRSGDWYRYRSAKRRGQTAI